MSCVVGLLKDGKLYMGSEGRATTDEGENRPIIATKMFWNGPYLLGFAGSVRTGQLLKPQYFDPPDDISEFPDSMIELLGNKGSLATSDDQLSMQNCNVLVGFENRLYEILSDFQLNEVYGDYLSIGSGASYALGSLYTSRRVKSAEKRVTLALQAACFFDTSCGPPFFIEIME
jgi:ATP-dependent protease HslVU (ClpYQ) peptidase subunit